MNITDYLFIGLGIFEVVIGLASLFTGKVYKLGSRASQYTEDSLKAFARPGGIASIILGIGLILYHLLPQTINGGEGGLTIGMIIFFACLAVALGVDFIAYKKLVKKDAQ